MSANLQAILLAAGKGTRMRSDRPKVLHEILGRPLIGWVVDAALAAGASRIICVLGYGREQVEAYLATHPAAASIEVAVQTEQLGTAHAVWSARAWLEADDAPPFTTILSGDVPNISPDTLRRFVEHTQRRKVPMGLITAVVDDPARYGRVLRDHHGEVSGIIEYADATPSQRAVDEINAGLYVARTDFLRDHLPIICEGSADTAQNEYYLTDLVAMAAQHDGICGWAAPDLRAIQGVNTRAHLASAAEFAQQRINQRWMEAGVTMLAPRQTYVEPTVELSQDVTLYPGVHLKGATRVGAGSTIENASVLADAHLAPDCHVKAHCYITDADIGSNTAIGPFAHLRPGSDIGQDCKIGNFVEVKKARLADGVKAGHLSYLGDADIGELTNVGAGTITCNYDGAQKHKTVIGKRCFIGSNTALVAPVTLADDAYVGAGSTITDDVPPRALAVARARQRNVEDWNQR